MNNGWQHNIGAFGGSNYTKSFDGFYISYNPDPSSGFSLFAADDGGDETALCHDGQFYILNGDFRGTYDELGPKGFAACFEFFTKQNNVSSWSSELSQA
jgi:hypothetical protein